MPGNQLWSMSRESVDQELANPTTSPERRLLLEAEIRRRSNSGKRSPDAKTAQRKFDRGVAKVVHKRLAAAGLPLKRVLVAAIVGAVHDVIAEQPQKSISRLLAARIRQPTTVPADDSRRVARMLSLWPLVAKRSRKSVRPWNNDELAAAYRILERAESEGDEHVAGAIRRAFRVLR